MSRFIHGEFALKIIGNILYAHAKGPFNVEFVTKFRAETEEAASTLHGTRWASIIVFEGDNLMPLDAEAIIVEALKKESGARYGCFGGNFFKHLRLNITAHANNPYL